jgi:hypothetical protein
MHGTDSPTQQFNFFYRGIGHTCRYRVVGNAIEVQTGEIKACATLDGMQPERLARVLVFDQLSEAERMNAKAAAMRPAISGNS